MNRPASNHTVSSKVLFGIVLVLLSAVFLATQNVISRLFFVPGDLFGRSRIGGWLPSQFSNIVMLLSLRMALMAGLLASVAPRLYPKTFSTLQQLKQHRQLLSCVIGSGSCLFVGLTALYFALSQVAAGIAIATFFIYPAITLLLAWRFLQQPPRTYQLGLMPVIFLGVVLTTQDVDTSAALSTNPALGIIGGLIAGLSFGLYGIFAEIALQPSSSNESNSKNKQQNHRQPLYPVPFSLITFIVVSALGGLSLLLMPPVQVSASAWQPTLITTLFSALITVTAYVLNNFGALLNLGMNRRSPRHWHLPELEIVNQ